MIDHMNIKVADFERAKAFYDAPLRRLAPPCFTWCRMELLERRENGRLWARKAGPMAL